MFVSVLGPLCSIPIWALSHPYTLCMPTNMSRNIPVIFLGLPCNGFVCDLTHGNEAHHLKWCKAIPLPLSNLSQCQNPISSLHMLGEDTATWRDLFENKLACPCINAMEAVTVSFIPKPSSLAACCTICCIHRDLKNFHCQKFVVTED